RRRDHLVLSTQPYSAARVCRPGYRVCTDRALPGTHRQLHQWRTVGPAGARLAALGDDLPQRWTDPAPPQPVVRIAARARGAVHRGVPAVATGTAAGALRLAERRLPGWLRHRAHDMRVIPRARRFPRVPDRRRHDGAAAMYPDADRRALADAAHQMME